MSNIGQHSNESIDYGRHRTPESVLKQARLLASVDNNNNISKKRIENTTVHNGADEAKDTTLQQTKLPISGVTESFIRNYPKEAEDLISWYTNIKNNKNNKNKLFLGINGFPIKVRVNPMLIKKEDNYLTVFVRSDNSLEISLPVASEVILEGEINGETLPVTTGMFLGEISFDKNFLFKILIFVVK